MAPLRSSAFPAPIGSRPDGEEAETVSGISVAVQGRTAHTRSVRWRVHPAPACRGDRGHGKPKSGGASISRSVLDSSYVAILGSGAMSDLQKARAGRGRIIPFKQREVEGTTRKAAAGPAPVTKRKLGTPPKASPEEVKAVWRELQREVDWLVQSSDRKLVERFCHDYASWRIARDRVWEEGAFYTGMDGREYETGAAIRERTLAARIDKLLPKLGMTTIDAHRVFSSEVPSVKTPGEELFDD